MSESEKISFSRIVEQVRAVNASVDQTLSAPELLSELRIDELNLKLQERESLLLVLREGTGELEKNGDYATKQQIAIFWNAFCEELYGNDQVRLLKIEQKMNELANSVRLTRKRQLLLQYR